MSTGDPPETADRTQAQWGQAGPAPDETGDPLVGGRVGAFRLREVLGQGGMGTVYLAEQLEPVRRTVALKLLRGSLLNPRHVARFTVEQQALARMSHPAIAQVYDAGTTADGRPYFAMEYVAGEPITEFCVSEGLDLRQRLELFAKVCRGVQHAHQKGMIHRDLKPTNILVQLVDGQPAPKIIDFGIATAIRAAGDDRERGRPAPAGTPMYMSPEQADFEEADLDTRSDIYSLGAVLYELITGTTPLDPGRLRETPHDELRRVLRETQWERPSQRLREAEGSLAALARSAADRRRLLLSLRTEIDWIVAVALAKDRGDRYASAAALAEDVEAFLAGRPVEAVPATLRYRLGKLAVRHKAMLAAGAAVSLALVAGLGLATWGLMQAREQRDRARVEAAKSARIAGFIQEMLAGVDPAAAGELDKTLMRRILEGASAKIGSELADQPEVAAAIHHTLGVTYQALGEYDAGQEHLTAALETWRRHKGPDAIETISAMVELSLVTRSQGRFADAEKLLEDALPGLRAIRGDEHPETLSAITNLANLLMWQGRLDEAEGLYVETLATCRRVLGDDHEDTLTAANNLGLLYADQGRFADAEPLYLEVLERSRKTLGSTHPETLISINNMAALYEQMGRLDEAETLYLEALDGSRKVLGAEHPETLNLMNNVAVLYSRQGRMDEAEGLHSEVLAGSRRALGDDHPDTLNSMNNLAFTYSKLGRFAAAAELLEEAAAAARRTLPADSVLAGGILSNYGEALARAGRYDEAERTLVEARAILERVLGPDHGLTRTASERLEDVERLRGAR